MFQFLLYEPIHQAGQDVLRAVGEVRVARDTSEEGIIAEIGDVDGVIIRARGAMTRRILQHAPRLKVVGRHGVGVDNVDVAACTEHGVQVVNTPLAVVEGVAEHTLGMMLALSKRIVYGDRRIRQGGWEERIGIEGRELCGRSLGVVGFGRIGRRVAQLCHHGLSMRIFYADVVPAPALEQELGARRLPLPDLLATCEYITVHVPLTPETRGLIGEAEFARMRPDAMFFNLSRGPVVDERALYRALRDGRIAGAGLDVFAEEPPPEDNPLFGLHNVVLTPHIATATVEALRNMALVAEDVVAVLEGRQPRFAVNRLAAP